MAIKDMYEIMNIIKDGLKRCIVSLADMFGLRFNPNRFLPVTYLKYDAEKEGKIFFVLTEDNEQPKGDGRESALSPSKIEECLVYKLQLADEIANQYGVKWTHFMDIGSGLLLLKWAAEVSNNEEWIALYEKRKQALIQSYAKGNDIQLHIHSYHVPSSPNFRWQYDPIRNIIYQPPLLKSKKIKKRTFGGWAIQGNKIESRINSLTLGKKALEELFEQYIPEYKVVCFRAGGWDIGDNEIELRESFSALAKEGILLDSSLTKGAISQARWLSDYGLTFEVGAPIDKNIYKIDGIFELFPTQPRNLCWTSMQYISPLDNPAMVQDIYKGLLNKDGTIKPGFHFIVEMFHIHNIKNNSDDFKQLDYHFKYLKERCPKMKYLTGSEVVSNLIQIEEL